MRFTESQTRILHLATKEDLAKQNQSLFSGLLLFGQANLQQFLHSFGYSFKNNLCPIK
jgi:hypothetical protein